MFLVLERSGDDKSRYNLPGVGSIWRPSWWNGVTKARTVDGADLVFRTRGSLGGRYVAEAGATTLGSAGHRAGTAVALDGSWQHHDFTVWPTNRDLADFRIAVAGEVVAEVRVGGAWKERPAAVDFEPGDLPDPTFLLYGIWLSHSLRSHTEAIKNHGWEIVGD